MLNIRRADERGKGEHGWLHSRHTFSFANYYDPRFTGFRDLLVINEDRVDPGHGFGTHGHRDMEIISYVLDGALEHADSMGVGSVVRPGNVQRMSAGTGVRHSEYNHSKTDPLHFLQIWILPSERGLAPSYEEKTFSREEKTNRLRLVASADGRDGSVLVHQDVSLYAAIVEPGVSVTFEPGAGRHVWLHVARGSVQVNGRALDAGDAVSESDAAPLTITGIGEAEVLLFDLA